MSYTLDALSSATSKSRSTLLAIVAGVFLLVVVVAPTPGAALAGGIDGCFFRDLNGSSIQGDAENPGSGGESAFVEPIVVRLNDTANGTFTTTTTDSQTGCFEMDGLAAGVAYELIVNYPAGYYSSPTGVDTDFIPDPAPTVASDPFRARYAFTYTAGADLSISGGVSAVAELSLGYFIVPSGEQMIQTGTAPFDTSGNCPTQTSGDDCGQYDDVVRTNDLTTIGYTVTATNIPDGGTQPLDSVVLEEVITPSDGAVIEVPSLHSACLTTGVTPPSGVETNSDTGVITMTCNLGPKDNGTTPVPTYIRTDGRSADGASFVVRARVYTADDRAQTFDSKSVLAPESIQISAMPRFDITKGRDAANPYNSVNYYQTTERTNPVTGVQEFGVNYQWDISVIYDGGIKGQAALDGPITFSDVIPAEFTGWELVECKNQPYYFGSLPIDEGDGDWGERGEWDCVEDRANNEIDITVTNVDTDGDPLPSVGADGTDLTNGPSVAFAGSVKVWYPLSDFYRTVDSSWDYGHPSITGDYELENLVGKFDPTASGVANFGGVAEPAANNQHSTTVSIKEEGRFSNHIGAFEWADAQLADGPAVATRPSLWPCTPPSVVEAGSLLKRQTQSCYQADGAVQPGQRAHLWLWLENHGTSPWASETFKLCDAFDSSTLDLTTWATGTASFVRVHGIDAEAIVVEFATADWVDDPVNNDWTNQQAAIGSCAAPNDDWSTDPFVFDTDPDASLAKVGMIRVTVDPDVQDVVLPNDHAHLSFPVKVRDTFLGGPNDGDPIPVGTILANHANRAFGTTDFDATTSFNPVTNENYLWGARMWLNRHEVSVRATVTDDLADSTSDSLSEVRSTDQVVWWFHPTVQADATYTATGVGLTTTLSSGLEFDSFCQASLPYPDADVSLVSVTENSDGTTTLEFDLGAREANAEIGPIPVCTNIGPFLEPGRTLASDAVIRSDTDVSPVVSRSASRSVEVVADELLQLTKFVDAPLELQLDSQHYTMGWTNLTTDFVFAPPDVIDVLPYGGDGANPLNQRDQFDSDFTGSYGLTDWLAQPTTEFVDGSERDTGGTWYYTSDDPSTVPHDADAAANDLAAGSVNWCSQTDLVAAVAPCDFGFADATAIRFRQTENLETASRVKVSFSLRAGSENDSNKPADRYANRFAARTASIQHVLESNEVLVQVMSFLLGDLVFHDADVDGRYTPDVDVPASGVSVELWGDDESGSRVQLGATTTDDNGRYVFDHLVEGVYEVRIPIGELSSGPLEGLVPSLVPQPADEDDNEDVDHSATDSGLGYITSGPVTLNAKTDRNPPLGLEPTGENVAGLGEHFTYDNLTNLSVDLGFKGEPAVQLVVEVCHQTDTVDCDPTSGVNSADDDWVESVAVGYEESAQWRLTAINTGDEVLTSIRVSDAAEASCDRTAASIGDLGLGESHSWVCATDELIAAKINNANLTAEGIGSGIEVGSTDSASAEVPSAEPGLAVAKLINDVAAPAAPGLPLNIGDAVTFTYSLSTGDSAVPSTDVKLTDDNATPSDPSDDWSPRYVSGDTNGNDRLDVGEVWLYQASGGTAAAGQHSSSVTASAQPVTANSARVTAGGTANYFGFDAEAGLVQLVATVNGSDANAGAGPFVAVGETAVFNYSLTNTGDMPLEVVGLFDDAGSGDTSDDDWTPTLVGGDVDGDDRLDIDETWLYVHTVDQAIAGGHVGEARASVTASDGRTADVTDPVHYFGANPAIAIEHATNTIDADDPADSVPVVEGGNVRWLYTVSNAGNVALSSVAVTDDVGTPAAPDDDVVAALVSGDDNNDGLLDVDEVWLFERTGVAASADYRNNASVTAVGPAVVDATGTSTPGSVVTDDDPSGYRSMRPGIALVALTNGTDNPTGSGPTIAVGNDVEWTYRVTNPGNVALTSVRVTDDAGTADDLSDDIVATYRSGDANGDGRLDPSEEWTFAATGVAQRGSYVHTATVSGLAPASVATDGSTETGVTVSDSDDDRHIGSEGSFEVTTSVKGHEATTELDLYVVAGDEMVWTYEIVNSGTTPLAEIEVVADGVVTCPSTVLGGGESMTCTSEPSVVIPGSQTNAGTVLAKPAQACDCPERFVAMVDSVTGEQVESIAVQHRSNYYGVAASVDINVEVCDLNDAADCQIDDDSHWVEEAVVARGGRTAWRVTVVNTGNIDLVEVTVAGDNVEACDWARATLESGQSVSYQCESPSATGSFTNTAVVTASDSSGIVGLLTDADAASTTVSGSLTTVPGTVTTVPGTVTTESGTATTVPATVTTAPTSGTATSVPAGLAFTGSSNHGMVLFAVWILAAGLALSTRMSTRLSTKGDPPTGRS